MNKVLIMLSTYNGQKYLREQLDSLYAQEGVDIHILVRDDGSTDETVSILEEYKEKRGKMTILAEENVGCAMSFYTLMDYAYEHFKDCDYYAFSDQDDVWMNHKLYASCRQINKKDNRPYLFYAPAIPVNKDLKPLKPSTIRVVNCLGANIASSHSLGCTQVFNRQLLSYSARIYRYAKDNLNKDDYRPLHDAWTALVGYSLGEVAIGEAPVMYYRQHGNNVIGSGKRGLGIYLSRLKHFIAGGRKKSAKCRILLDVVDKKDIQKQKLELIHRCAYYDDSYVKRLKLAFTRDIYHYGFLDNIGLLFMIITNKF